MKSLYSIIIAALLFSVTLPSSRAEMEVSIDFFHDNLEPYGDWREVGDYGYCWQPRDVDRDWRPYSDGSWAYTDAGWTWVSEEPYGWAVYHYGRWARIDEVGWVWVPGREWGPAWVSWRRGSRHVGWAPLPPEARFERSSGFRARVDVEFDIGPANYSFVEVRNFGARRLRTVFVEPSENITIINQTTNITNITYVNSVVYNQGPQYDVISRESAEPVRRLKLARRENFEGDPSAGQLRSSVEGDTLRVVAPTIDAAKPAKAPRKVVAKVEKAQVNRGWKNAGPPEEVEKARNKMKSEPVAAVEQAPVPAGEADALDGKPKQKPSVLSPEMNEKRAKEQQGKDKVHSQDTPPAPNTPAPATAPAITEVPAPAREPKQPDATEKPVQQNKPPKNGKSPKQDPVISTPPVPVTPEAAQPQPDKRRNKQKETSRGPAPAPSQEVVVPQEKPARQDKPKRQERAPKQRDNIENAEPPRTQPSDAPLKMREEPAPKKEAARPKSEQSATRNPDRESQQARPQPPKRDQRSPAGGKPAPAQAEKPAKEKGKDRKNKNDDEEAPQ